MVTKGKGWANIHGPVIVFNVRLSMIKPSYRRHSEKQIQDSCVKQKKVMNCKYLLHDFNLTSALFENEKVQWCMGMKNWTF